MGLIVATVGVPFVLSERSTQDPSYCYIKGGARSTRAVKGTPTTPFHSREVEGKDR
jgi:hypothetical protein